MIVYCYLIFCSKGFYYALCIAILNIIVDIVTVILAMI